MPSGCPKRGISFWWPRARRSQTGWMWDAAARCCLSFGKVAWALRLVRGPCGGCGAQGTHPGGSVSAASCTGPVALGRCCAAAPMPGRWVRAPASRGFVEVPVSSRPFPKLPARPQIFPNCTTKSLFLSFSSPCYRPVSKKRRFRWVIWRSAGLSTRFA